MTLPRPASRTPSGAIAHRLRRSTSRRTGEASAQYASAEQCVRVLNDVLKTLGIKPYQLAGMLDLPFRSHVYEWFKGKRRPSSFYLPRLVHFQNMALRDRLDIHTFDGGTYWDTVGLQDERGKAVSDALRVYGR